MFWKDFGDFTDPNVDLLIAFETAKNFSVLESSCHLPTCLPHTVKPSVFDAVCFKAERQVRNCVAKFYRVWLDPLANRIKAYRFVTHALMWWTDGSWTQDQKNPLLYLAKPSR